MHNFRGSWPLIAWKFWYCKRHTGVFNISSNSSEFTTFIMQFFFSVLHPDKRDISLRLGHPSRSTKPLHYPAGRPSVEILLRRQFVLYPLFIFLFFSNNSALRNSVHKIPSENTLVKVLFEGAWN